MARDTQKLTADIVLRAHKPGYYGDGGGLWLRIGPTGAKSWVFRYRADGKQREMGLGPIRLVNLAEARIEALEHSTALMRRRHGKGGYDPLERREADRAAQQLKATTTMTFRECAERYIAAHKAGWHSSRHLEQWEGSLRDYVYPVFGVLPVQAIDTALVRKAVSDQFWKSKPETASRVRARIEAVLGWAAANGYRQPGDNPARWRGHLEHMLPRKTKVRRVEHHAALPYAEVSAFMAKLRAQPDIAARALEFLILTAVRSGEVLGARWSEIDLDERVWNLPPSRMKAGRQHRVPLSDTAITILTQLDGYPQRLAGGLVFPSPSNPSARINRVVLFHLLRRMGHSVATHGFRSTFRDWAAERTAFPSEVAEMALAHAVGDKVEAAYRRGDMFEKRRQLADAWARYCERVEGGGEVVPLRAGV